MAAPSSIKRAQNPILCNLCDTDNKIISKCIDCELLMCKTCRDNRHSRIKNASKHKVVDIKEIGKPSNELDFTSIPCNEHKGQFSVMFCKSCEECACLQCIATIHNGHTLAKIVEGYQIKIERLKDRQNILKVRVKQQIDEIRKKEKVKFLEAKDKIKAQNSSLKKYVDQHTEELLKEVDQQWETFNSSIEKVERRITALQTQDTSNTRLDDIINSNDAEKNFQKIKELEQTLSETDHSKELNFTAMPIFIPGEITQYNFGSLQNTTDFKIRLEKEFTTDISAVGYMSPCFDQGIESLWISNRAVLKKVKPAVNNLTLICSHKIKVCGMAVTPTQDLLLASDRSVITQISGSTGQLEDSVYHTDPLQPIAVHVTRDYKVLIGVMNKGQKFPVTGRRAVISMDKDGKNKTFFEHDIYNKSIFSYPREITTTQTGNICVIDKLSSDWRGRIVVLSQEGGVITKYSGQPTVNSATKPFKPVYIQTTPADNIIVTDVNTDALHILNNTGNIITHINTKDIGIIDPFSITFTEKGKMYIGCTTRQASTSMAKLCEVKLSEY